MDKKRKALIYRKLNVVPLWRIVKIIDNWTRTYVHRKNRYRIAKQMKN